ncbi:MAG: hypothetical protein ACLQUT_12970 [Thermoleophilia bacterium]
MTLSHMLIAGPVEVACTVGVFAFGEWGGSELLKRVGYVPHGLATLGDRWRGVLPDYGQSNASGAWAVVMSVASALIGVAVLAGLA